MKILSFGEILFDVINGEEHIGGAPFNLAAHLSQLGEEVWMYSALGQDERGEKAQAKIKELGVIDSYIKKVKEFPTGFVTIEPDKEREPNYDIHEGVAWDNIEAREIKEDFDCLYFGTLAQRSQISRNSLLSILKTKKFKEVFLDVNLRQNYYSKEVIEESLQAATIVKMNEEEFRVVAKLLFAGEIEEKNVVNIIQQVFALKILIITRGKDGASIFQGKEHIGLPGKQIKEGSTIGAGDAFSAGFLHKLLRGSSLKESGQFAIELGAFVASQVGAITDLKSFMIK